MPSAQYSFPVCAYLIETLNLTLEDWATVHELLAAKYYLYTRYHRALDICGIMRSIYHGILWEVVIKAAEFGYTQGGKLFQGSKQQTTEQKLGRYILSVGQGTHSGTWP